ncbi:MAG: carboxypeptidase regulatory-like domain-containing protein [Saprospiraceae bacterium]
MEKHRAASAPEKLYLHLDRTFLQPGETVWFCAYVRNAGNLLPSLQSQILYAELLDARGSVLARKELLAFEGVAAGEFDFGQHLPGGLYKIKAYTRWMQNTDEAFERDITLQKVVLPNVNLRLEFERKAFGPGDVAIARFDAHSIDNKPLAHQKIGFTAAAGGQAFGEGEATTDANGRAYVRFTLPEKLESSDGLLNIRLEHNGEQEAISRPIPIVLHRVDLQFFPEGGDAVAGLACRMAFKAVNEFGKPADVEGLVLDSRGQEVAKFSSYHDGMGAFDFVPQPGERYSAQVTKPFFAEKKMDIPEAQATGVALRLQKRDAKSLTFELTGKQPGKMFLVGSQRDQLFFFKALKLGASSAQVTVPISTLPIGITRFTLFDENKNEIAERLAFVGRERGLQIELTPDKTEYLPREEVNLKIRVRDHAGQPVQGKFSLAVADEKLLSFADDKQGHLLASLLLEQDVKGKIEEPNFYFDPAEPKSEQALDYLLMTQGWRRFAWEKVLEENPVAAEHAPERAALEGHLWRKDGKPSWGGTVTLYPNGPSATTTQHGFFSFQNVDLARYTHLQYGEEKYHPIQGYRSDIVLRKGGASTQFLVKTSLLSCAPGVAVLAGKVLDDSGEGLIGATIRVTKGKDLVRGVITDYEGNYRVQLLPGTYDVEFSYVGYSVKRVMQVRVLSGKICFQEVIMSSNTVLGEVLITSFKVPLIEQDRTAAAQTRTSDQIKNLRSKSMGAIVAAEVNKDEAIIDDAPADKEERAQMEEVSIANSQILVIENGKADAREKTLRDGASRSLAKKRGWTSDELKLVKKPAASEHRLYRFSRAREFYVPKYEAQSQPAQRSDFRSTIYWNPNIATDKKGEAEVRFFTSDAITNFRATLEGIGNKGEIGRAEQKFFVQKPLSLAVKAPASVIVGDVLRLQIALTNKTKYPTGGHLSVTVPEHFSLTPSPSPNGEGSHGEGSRPSPREGESISLAAGETKIIAAEYTIGLPKGGSESVKIQFSADEAILDAFETSIRTLDRGFPVRMVASGNAAQNAFSIQLSDPVEGTVKATLTAYPNALEDVLKGMERMLRQPSGCFEQVSSSNYPNLLVLDLLRTTGAARPEVESRALTLLEDGYKKLTAYECKSGGFDWWGRDPAHEGLTAYGLLEFTDMAHVFPVDKSLMDRTSTWLRSRRDGKGGWQMNPNSLHGWQNDAVLEAYIAWAVAESGEGGQFKTEIEHAHSLAAKSDDPYVLALLANALGAMRDPRSSALIAQLLKKQEDQGSWMGASHSVFHSQGDALRIETTALAALALMKTGKHEAATGRAMEYIAKSKNEYGYGNTQSTVLALKALVEYAKTNKRPAADGVLVVQVDGKRVREQAFSNAQMNRVEIKDLEQFFANGNPRVEVFFEGTNTAIPFDLEIKYAARTPRNAPHCPLSFKTELGKTTASVGETLRLTATLKNETSETQASPMVVLGIPAGLTLQPWQLKKLVDEKQCDFYELWDGFAVFHYERLAPNESRQLALDLRADVAGTFEAPASQAFLYYQNEQRVWSKPERVSVRH